MFSADVIAAAKAHALADYPREACGLVVEGVYEPKANKASDPLNAFKIDPRCWATKRRIEAVIHSHCAAPGMFALPPDEALAKRLAGEAGHGQWPSADDMAHQVATGLPWGIVWCDGEAAKEPVWWGDHVIDEPLIGRNFEPGIRDCYALGRAWYWQERGITLPEVPRDDEWWHHGGDLFRECFAKAGFEIVTGAPQPGDALLMSIRSPVPNHCAIVLERGLILHHLTNRLSRREPANNWMRFVNHILRFKG